MAIIRKKAFEAPDAIRQEPGDASAERDAVFKSLFPQNRPADMSNAQLAADIFGFVSSTYFGSQALRFLEEGLAVIYEQSKSEDFRYPSPWIKARMDIIASYWHEIASRLKPWYEETGLLPRDSQIPLEPQTGWSKVPERNKAETQVVKDKRIITKGGIDYLPLSLAAWTIQTSESTLRDWIKKRLKFAKAPIQTYRSPTTSEIYVSELSVKAMESRFIDWPSREPIGSVVIGETADRSGFVGLPDAARASGISVRTLSHWAAQGKLPNSKPLRVVQCSTSGRLYISQIDADGLRLLERPQGLRRGPKPSNTPRP